MDNKTLTIVYTFFLGIILALFIGLGISTFYTGPKMPEYPTASDAVYTEKQGPTPEQVKAQRDFDTSYKQFDKDNKIYNRNVSMIALASAVILLVFSFAFEKRSQVIANGMLLGGVFTLLYSIVRGFVSEDTKYTFAAVCVGLVVALYLGYRRFAGVTSSKAKRKKRR